jgi:hypothetical protein
MNKVFILLTDDEITNAPAWALRDEVKRLTTEILRLRQETAQQLRALDARRAVANEGEVITAVRQ